MYFDFGTTCYAMLLHSLCWITVPAFWETVSLLIAIPCSAFRSALLLDAPRGAPSTALRSNLNVLPFQERVAKLKAKIV